MRHLLNRLAWKLVRATQSSAPKRPRCLCGVRHRAATVCKYAETARAFGFTA